MAIDSKNQLVWVKAMARGQALPLDASEVWESKEAAEAYATGIVDSSSVAYVGQTLKVVDQTNGTVDVYVIQDATGKLIKLADIDSIDNGSEVVVDSEMSETSTNPVQNKVIYEQIKNLQAEKTQVQIITWGADD